MGFSATRIIIMFFVLSLLMQGYNLYVSMQEEQQDI